MQLLNIREKKNDRVVEKTLNSSNFSGRVIENLPLGSYPNILVMAREVEEDAFLYGEVDVLGRVKKFAFSRLYSKHVSYFRDE